MAIAAAVDVVVKKEHSVDVYIGASFWNYEPHLYCGLVITAGIDIVFVVKAEFLGPNYNKGGRQIVFGKKRNF